MLDGIRVLDLSGEAGLLAGKILGDLGADVIKVERPGGDPTRRGPFLGDIEDPERSLPWLALNTSKRGVTLDLEVTEGRELFHRLAATADVVLETDKPGALDAVGIGFASLGEANPRLIWCALTPFGQQGPYAGYEGSDLSVVALGGNAFATGWPDRPPVRCTMPAGYYHGAPEAALGIAMALYAREETGAGQFVDVSLQEAQLQTLLSGPGQHAAQEGGLRMYRRPGDLSGDLRELWPALDGYVSYGLRGGPARIPNLVATVKWMEECGMAPDWLRDYDWSTFNHNLIEDWEPFFSAFGAFFASKTMGELYDEAVRRRIFLAPCNDAREVSRHPQLRSRDFFVTLDYPELGAQIEHPAFFAKTAGVAIRCRAPRIGEHNDALYGELGISAAERGELKSRGVI
ncbi:MAG: CoA transferase [Myxococcota bacterium]|nr:CoA transferase [Myxococcota bacterium]